MQSVAPARSLFGRFRRVGWAIGGQGLVSGGSFLTTLMVARFLGKEELGRFVLAWLCVWIVQNIQIALITTPVTTFAPRVTEDERPAYFGAVWVHTAIFAAITTVLTYVLALWSRHVVPNWQLDEVAGPLALVILFGQITDIQRRYFYIHEHTHRAFVLDVSRHGTQLLGLAGLFMFWPGKATLYALLVVIAASALLGCCVAGRFIGPAVFRWDTIKQVGRRHWNYARWLLGSTVLYCGREGFVSVVVGSLLGLTEVGILRAIQQLVMTINIPLYVMHNTVPANASVAYGQHGFPGLVGFMRGFALKYFCFLLTVLLTIGAFGEPLLTTLYGRAYAGYGGFVMVAAAIMIVFLVRDFLAIMVKTIEKTDFDFYASAVGTGITLVLLVPLLRSYGLGGALLTEGLMQVAMLAMMARGLKDHWRNHPNQGGSSTRGPSS